MAASTSVEDYLAGLPEAPRAALEKLRKTIKTAAPEATESISYQMPTFKRDGNALVYIGGWKHHIGLYPVPQLAEPLENEVSKLRAAKDTLRFSYNEPLPDELIQKVIVALSER